MEFILVLLLIILIILVSNAAGSQRKFKENLEAKVDRLLRETAELKKELQTLADGPLPTRPAPLPPERPAAPKVQAPIVPTPEPPLPRPAVPQPVKEPVAQEPKPATPKPVFQPAPPKESWWQTWMRNNPDLEKFIGENLVNKIGIAILVLGIAFFVKYAIDKDWINEVGRVCIGLFCGGVLVALAHYLRNSYRSFSSVLAGGGIAVFYFTIAFAFHQYHLLSQTAAFVLMVVITGFAVALSLLYNKLELAVIAVVGGFLTPFLVSTGEGNYVVLFTYLVILNTGLLALSYFKRWPLVNLLAFAFTEIIFGGWLFEVETSATATVSYPVALLFASLLYLQFLGMNTLHQLAYRQRFKPLDFSLLVLLNASFFAAGLLLLQHVQGGLYRGVFTLAVGLVNLVLAWWFFKTQNGEKNFLFLLIGLTLTFLTLTVPIQLHGHAITLFWLAETVLLFWLYSRSRIRVFYFSSLLVMVAALVSLLMDWAQAAIDQTETVILLYANLQGLVTNLFAVASFAALAQLVRKEAEPLPFVFSKRFLRNGALLPSAIIAYLTAVYGVNLLFRHAANYDVPNVYHRLVTEAFVVGLLFWLKRRYGNRAGALSIGAVSVYLVYHIASIAFVNGVRNGVLAGTTPALHLWMHWLSVVVALTLVYVAVQRLRQTAFVYFPVARLCWILSFFLLVFFSQEAGLVFVALFYRGANLVAGEAQYNKAVLTIVWGLCSFGAMWLGMRHKNKTLRIVSLSIFSVALVKLFFFDLADLSEGGKIAAFILLGVLLLTISFMYQKLKKIIIDEKP